MDGVGVEPLSLSYSVDSKEANVNSVRVYMRASRSDSTTVVADSSDVTILEYKDAHYECNIGIGWLFVHRVDDEIAAFPPGDWTGV